MKITKEYVQTQIENLKKQNEQHVANVNAVSGAIQVYEQLLSYLEIPEEEQPCDSLSASPAVETGNPPLGHPLSD
jgi:hypothetical protein